MIGLLKTQDSENQDHGVWFHHFMQIDGETMETVRDFIFGVPKSLQMMTEAMQLKDACSLEEKVMSNLDSILKSRDIANKGPSSQSYGFSSSHVWM